MTDIIEVLLEHKIQLGDALLRAVEEQFTGAVLMICEHIKQKNIPVRRRDCYLHTVLTMWTNTTHAGGNIG